MSDAWIETFTGLKFDILDPQPESIIIEDIAHALSLLCRFTGHVKFFYPVGQHSYLASLFEPEIDPLDKLMHDASEAYISDLSRPLKHFTDAGKAYMAVEDKIQRAINEKFGLRYPMPESVHKADNAMLYAEKEQLMAPCDWNHRWYVSEEVADVKIVEWTPRMIERLFLRRFNELT